MKRSRGCLVHDRVCQVRQYGDRNRACGRPRGRRGRGKRSRARTKRVRGKAIRGHGWIGCSHGRVHLVYGRFVRSHGPPIVRTDVFSARADVLSAHAVLTTACAETRNSCAEEVNACTFAPSIRAEKTARVQMSRLRVRVTRRCTRSCFPPARPSQRCMRLYERDVRI
jgi:hypothetical protein